MNVYAKNSSRQEVYADLVIAALRIARLIQSASCWALRDQDTGSSSSHTRCYTGENDTTEKGKHVTAATHGAAERGQSDY